MTSRPHLRPIEDALGEAEVHELTIGQLRGLIATAFLQGRSMGVEDRAVTKARAADMLGVSVDLIERFIKKGELRVIREGSKVIVPVKEIDAWIDTRLAGGGTDWWREESRRSRTAPAASTGGKRTRSG